MGNSEQLGPEVLRPDLSPWTNSPIRQAIAEVEESLAKKIANLETRVLSLVRYTREQAQLRVEHETDPLLTNALGPVEEAIKQLTERVRMLEHTLNRSERAIAGNDELRLSQMAELIEKRIPAVRTALLSQKLDRLQETIAAMGIPGRQDQQAFLQSMVDIVDSRVSAGPVEALTTRLDDLEQTLAESWKRSVAQYNEDKKRLVDDTQKTLAGLTQSVESIASTLEQLVGRNDSRSATTGVALDKEHTRLSDGDPA